jgi:protein-disulfide isomerase
LESNENIKVKIIFSVPKDRTSTASKVVGHLMALYEKNNNEMIKHALDDWYNADKKDYDAFAAKYRLNGELQKQGEKLEMMEKWCEETVIHFTPTIFVNGYQLPEVYKLDDLKHLL